MIIPLIELFTTGSDQNLSEIEEEMAKKDLFYDFLLYSMVPLQYFILGYFLFQISNEGLPFYVKVGMTLAMGMSCGVLGINAAHELGHRTTGYERMMSKMLLLTSLYMHFYIEHNRGHHKNVATDEDPASSRYGESLYRFYIRSVIDSYFSAWNLEAKRLKKDGQPIWSFNNEMVRFQLTQLALILIIGFAFSWSTLLFFIAAATIGFLMLENVNYIEHYGLSRTKKGETYERTKPQHSWNSNHPLGRLMLLELSRHSDHHYLASRKYQILRHHDESPQMPTGYAGMMLLALVPPLWFSVMHRIMNNE